MSEGIRVLQLGDEDWRNKYILPEGLIFCYVMSFTQIETTTYDIIFLDRELKDQEIELIQKVVKAHTLYVTESVEMNEKMAKFYACNKGQRLPDQDIQRFLLEEVKFYYSKPSYGDKFRLGNIAIAQGFPGKVTWNGGCDVTLEGDFGVNFCQIVFWRTNLPFFRGAILDLWLEYASDPEVEVSLIITQFPNGSVSDVVRQWEFNETELSQIVQISNKSDDSYIFASLRARGTGKLRIITLNYRDSRGGHGFFLPGGERYVTTEREEIFCYFDPGDMQPPLNVYFSGYKTLQGFEGYFMMKELGSPFLLISEPRLEGGSYYIGSYEYENLMVNIIQNHMAELDFSSNQVILSGISMGSSGALYYGCDIRPHALILGKPLASLGNVAANHRFLPPASANPLDMLLAMQGRIDDIAVQSLNNHFWRKFDAADWRNTKFILAYMIEDELDAEAYPMLLSHLRSGGVKAYGKGLHGRHNDNTGGIVSWFKSQYRRVLYEDFSRKEQRR